MLNMSGMAYFSIYAAADCQILVTFCFDKVNSKVFNKVSYEEFNSVDYQTYLIRNNLTLKEINQELLEGNLFI
jgi:hypothetical protein